MTAPRRAILCVDDDHSVLASVVRVLRALPAEILWTTSPFVALEMIREREIAVLVSDFEMPELSGIELATAARQARPETVRVLLTGRQSFETALLGINQGEVFRYLNKPLDTQTLRRVIGEALAHHEMLVAPISLSLATSRKAERERALEAEHPGMTHVERNADGVYIIPDPPSAELGEGLAGLAQLGRQK